MILKEKYKQYKRKEGRYGKGESKTDMSQAQDTDIYNCLEKYGMMSLINQSMAKEPLYLDNTNNMSLADALRMRDEIDTYYEQLPARVRKVFGDNPDEFYEKYKRKEFEQFLETGVLTDEQVKELQRDYDNNNRNNSIPSQNDMGNIQNTEGSIQQAE